MLPEFLSWGRGLALVLRLLRRCLHFRPELTVAITSHLRLLAGSSQSPVLGMAFLAIEIPLTALVSAGTAPNYDAVDYINESWVLVWPSLPVAWRF